MKKSLILTALLLAVGSPLRADKLKVVATTTDLAWITEQIGGEKVDVTSIARGYQDPHFVESKPSFLFKLRDADLLEVVGLDLEIGWLPPLLDQSRNLAIRPGGSGYLDLSSGVEILDRPTGPVDRSMGDIHAMGNPHYWLEPGNAIRIAIQVSRTLSTMRPDDAAYFDANLQRFRKAMADANNQWAATLAPFKGAKIVTYHQSWTNFAKRYGLDVVGFVEPKPGVPPSPSHTFSLIRLMKEQRVRAIVVEPYFDLRTPNSIAAKTGAKVVVLYPSTGGRPELDSYFKTLDYNVRTLADALR